MRTHMLVAIALLVAGCASGPQGAPVASTLPAPGSALVTCLVPGQIRQLDNSVTYLTAPRPVKTTARECELRGGRVEQS